MPRKSTQNQADKELMDRYFQLRKNIDSQVPKEIVERYDQRIMAYEDHKAKALQNYHQRKEDPEYREKLNQRAKEYYQKKKREALLKEQKRAKELEEERQPSPTVHQEVFSDTEYTEPEPEPPKNVVYKRETNRRDNGVKKTYSKPPTPPPESEPEVEVHFPSPKFQIGKTLL